MRYIDKLILHVTHNLFPINEYSEGEIKRLMDKFQEEADDLNINITEPQLKTYIQRFDQIKENQKIIHHVLFSDTPRRRLSLES